MSIHFPNFFSLHPVYKYPHCSDPSTFCHIKTPFNRQILNHKIEIINKMSSADDQYEQQNDITSDDAPLEIAKTTTTSPAQDRRADLSRCRVIMLQLRTRLMARLRIVISS
jgi:hypothetical protein